MNVSLPIDERRSGERLTVPTDWTWQLEERQVARAHPRPRRRVLLSVLVFLLTGAAGGFAWYSLFEIDGGHSLRRAGLEFQTAVGEGYERIMAWFR